MLIRNLYKDVLIDPANSGSNELFAISGYASATFANRHLSELSNLKLNLIIGMPGRRSDHLGYMNLISRFGGRFNGYYLQGSPPVHCKAYAWYNGNNANQGFSGSANYSQPGFFSKYQLNQMTTENPVHIKDLFDDLLIRSTAVDKFTFTGLNNIISKIPRTTIAGSVVPGGILWEIPDIRVRISFLARNGTLPQRSGLNWGQRPDQNREPNQAYLSLKADSRNEGFLPPIGETFTLITDDNTSMDCVVAQQGRKAIHSTLDNSEIGRYIRKRIEVPLGSAISSGDLEQYGRTDYTIEKINEETFLLDLSV